MLALMSEQFGRLAAEVTTLNQAAPVDVRINTIKGSRGDARAALAAAGIDAAPTPLSPVGLRLSGTPRLDDVAAYKDGLIEVQDEGSQLVAQLTGAAPGMTVFDICAGAGGKALALASMMENAGRVIAADAAENRLKRMAPRRRRSGAAIIETRIASAEEWPEDERESADVVLADVPCSGSGAWRRHPEARWRLTAEALAGHGTEQRAILAAAARLVKPGGRLIYATCSVLPAENAEQVEWFLESRADFTLLPADKVWAETIGGPYPFSGPCAGPYLSLTPASTATDGFFAAVLEKRRVG